MVQFFKNILNLDLKGWVLAGPFIMTGLLTMFDRRRIRQGAGWQPSSESDADGRPY